MSMTTYAEPALNRLQPETLEVVAHVSVALARLYGLDRDDIANVLDELDLQGSRKSAMRCPLAQFVGRDMDQDSTHIHVEEDTLVLYTIKTYGEGIMKTKVFALDLPAEVSGFVKDFDEGYWPGLDADYRPGVSEKEYDGDFDC